MGGVFPGSGGMSAYLIEDGIRLSENRLVRKAQDDEPLGAKPVVSRLILGLSQHMDAAIGLQHELVGRTAAVGDIGANGHLTTEAQGVDLPVADPRSTAPFRRWSESFAGDAQTRRRGRGGRPWLEANR